ncbi:hypothetical protein Tco_1102692 [Tanacetum coccineum]
MKMMVATVVVASAVGGCGIAFPVGKPGGGSDAGDVVRMLEMIVVVVVEMFELMVITKAPTLRGLARSFLLRASAAMFAFTRTYCSSSHELSVVKGRKISPSPSASL